jgi:serine/threonine protein kinase
MLASTARIASILPATPDHDGKAPPPGDPPTPSAAVEEEKPVVNTAPTVAVSLSVTIATPLCLEAVLGEGAFATVFRANYQGKPIAVKRLHEWAGGDEAMHKKALGIFQHEVNVLRKIAELRQKKSGSLSSAIDYYGYRADTSQKPPVYDIYLELVSGQDLLTVSRHYRHKTRAYDLPPLLCAGILEKTTLAAAELPAHGIVHNDLNLKNIMLTTSGEIKIIDWAFAIFLEGKEAKRLPALRGTPRFMAYEILLALSSPASDVFSMGGVIFSLAFGMSPFWYYKDSSDVFKKLNELEHSQIPQGNPAIEEIVTSCWNKEPHERPRMVELAKRFSVLHASLAETKPTELPENTSAPGLSNS